MSYKPQIENPPAPERCQPSIVERLRNPNFAKSPTFAQSYMREAADRIEALEAALGIIEAKTDGERSTVNPQNAFEHFGRMNATMVEIRQIARATLAAYSHNQLTPVMQAAENAAKKVEGWSDAKKEYVDRILGSAREARKP